MFQPAATPDGSKIELIELPDGLTLRWKPPSLGFMKYHAAFLALWLCGWAVGWCAAVFGLVFLMTTNEVKEAKLFLVVWLMGWTIGGCLAINRLYRLLGPSVAESVTLGRQAFKYDSGSWPMRMDSQWYSNPDEVVKKTYGRRTRIETAKNKLGDVVLERIGERQRLYFDHGADRVEIGAHLREPEREWLAETIRQWKAT